MTPLPTPAMIIFDLDGTLVDTEEVNNRSFYDILAEIGSPPPYEEAITFFMGRSLQKCVEVALSMPGMEATTAEYLTQRGLDDALVAIENIQGDIAVSGSINLVHCYSLLLPLAVATNGLIHQSEIKLKRAGFYNAAPNLKLFSSEMVKNAKPAPDLYLYVAEQFGVNPSECWVVEDTVTGATAGIAAGMSVIGFIGCAHDKDKARQALLDAGCVMVIESYDQFPIVQPSSRCKTGS